MKNITITENPDVKIGKTGSIGPSSKVQNIVSAQSPTVTTSIKTGANQTANISQIVRTIPVNKQPVAYKVGETATGTEMLTIHGAETTEAPETKSIKIINTNASPVRNQHSRLLQSNWPPSPNKTIKTNITSVQQKNNTAKNANLIITTESNPSRQDVDDILGEINKHLEKWKTVENIDFEKTPFDNELHLGNNTTISRLCMLHYLSGDANFLSDQKNDANCTNNIKNYLSEGNIDFEKLINLAALNNPDGSNFVRNTEFYNNLYRFNVSMVEYLANSSEFRKAEFVIQKRLLGNIQNFIKQTITYLQKYMKQYQVIDNKLLDSSYNLLYLLNILSYRRANVGKNIDDIYSLYQRIVEAIDSNIELYNKIDTNKIAAEMTVVDSTGSNEISNLYIELRKRYAMLQEQKLQLEKNIAAIDADTKNLVNMASPEIKDIVNRLNAQIKTSIPVTTTTTRNNNTVRKNTTSATSSANVASNTNVVSTTSPITTKKVTTITTKNNNPIGQNINIAENETKITKKPNNFLSWLW